MSNELILREDNIRLVMSQAPQAWRDNQQSHDRCLASCQTLLDTIEAEGMNDELDQKADTYIRKSRNTVKKMNEQRSAVTKLFDEIRTVFTTLENEVDPTKKGSIPYQLQDYRNAYAARRSTGTSRSGTTSWLCSTKTLPSRISRSRNGRYAPSP